MARDSNLLPGTDEVAFSFTNVNIFTNRAQLTTMTTNRSGKGKKRALGIEPVMGDTECEGMLPDIIAEPYGLIDSNDMSLPHWDVCAKKQLRVQ